MRVVNRGVVTGTKPQPRHRELAAVSDLAYMSEADGETPSLGGADGRRSIGIMGGTFDPIHHGHLVAASEVMDVFGLDEVIFVPTAMQPFKAGRRVTQAEHRYLMTVVATASNPRFSVSRVDIDRGGTTYTVDTLGDLHAMYPNADFYFITGADALAQIAKWKDAEALFQQAHFIGVTRPGHELDASGLPRASVSLLEVPAMAISSSDCRSRVEAGKPVWYLVPDGVVQYIQKHRLYSPETRAVEIGDLSPVSADPQLEKFGGSLNDPAQEGNRD